MAKAKILGLIIDAAAEIPECARLATILDASRFKQPGRRRIKLELAHVQAIVAEAIKRNRISLALGTALQFETTLRQRDVIGEWGVGTYRVGC